jgi:XTP/dITP diphosphohydrolase
VSNCMDDRQKASVLLATDNEGKADEFRRLAPPHIELLSLSSFKIQLPPETGASFAEIAKAKAEFASAKSGLLSLADDSGLEVDALGGAPGIYSARFSGKPVDPPRNRKKLLHEMKDVPRERRTARFRCVIALSRHGIILATSDGVVEGSIGFEERGSFGFGYDSLFELPDGRTMAEVPSDEKNEISHRAVAFRAILPSLLAALAQPAHS